MIWGRITVFHESRYVYEVYRERSFSRAAQKLYISQPSLSAMVKRAETRIGGQIFDRSLNPVGLTQLGWAYIRATEQMMEIEDSFRRFISDAGECLTGSLAIGGTTLFTSYILPPLLSVFSARYPGVDIQVHETHTVALLRELGDGELDLIADNAALNADLYAREAFCEDRLLLMAPANRAVHAGVAAYRMSAEDVRAGRHLSADKPPVPLEWFREEPFLLLKEGNDTRSRADRLCAAAHFHPKTRLLLDQQITSYNLACYGMGAAFVGDTLVRSVPPMADVWFYNLDSALASREVSFFYRKSRVLNSAVREFMRTVREMSAVGENALRRETPVQAQPSSGAAGTEGKRIE